MFMSKMQMGFFVVVLLLFTLVTCSVCEIFFEERFDGKYTIIILELFNCGCVWWNINVFFQMVGGTDWWSLTGKAVKENQAHLSTQPATGLLILMTKVTFISQNQNALFFIFLINMIDSSFLYP